MKDITLNNFVEERIKENENLFTTEEVECIKNHKECINKIYLLGAIDFRECYKNDKPDD